MYTGELKFLIFIWYWLK